MTTTPLNWTTEKRKVSELINYKYNPRKMSAEQMRMLRNSLEEFGLAEIPVINADNTLVAGHQRCAAMLALGWGDREIDVRVPNRALDEKELKQYNFNSNAIKGDWVDNILQEHFSFIDFSEYGLAFDSLQDEISAKLTEDHGPAEMPIVAKMSEKYTAFIIVCRNEIDENHIAEKLGINRAKCYKSSKVGLSHIVESEKVIKSWTK